jgi:hypothetical protein
MEHTYRREELRVPVDVYGGGSECGMDGARVIVLLRYWNEAECYIDTELL